MKLLFSITNNVNESYLLNFGVICRHLQAKERDTLNELHRHVSLQRGGASQITGVHGNDQVAS
jgi:hypothetical protein